MRESKVEAHLVTVVKAIAGEVRKVKWIGRRSAPDRFVMLCELLPAQARRLRLTPRPARQIWVELKRPGVEAADHQRREHDLMRSMGCEVVVLDTIKAINAYLNYQP